ncbi:MAG TPA: DUF695 domain-containing protein [Flavisolibacter sp.]|nr:DUF695 domain-containing protein [Flavisolibacter sp.]
MSSKTATYTGFEFEVEGFPALAIINKDLADKNVQVVYPNAVLIEIIPDSYNEFGHPEEKEYDYLLDVEKKMIEYLEEQTETVHVGHTTAFRKREVIFYTKDADKVDGFLNYYLSTIERENFYEIEADPEWKNVSAFYELL